MAAGFTDAAMTIGLNAMVNRSFVIELHTDDPGNPVATTPLNRATIANKVTTANNGYYPEYVAQGGFVPESSSDAAVEARFANNADIDFGSATAADDNTGWGNVGWISIWYDADVPAAADPGTNTGSINAFDTLFAVMELQTAQNVNTNDPFVIRANTVDLINRNAT